MIKKIKCLCKQAKMAMCFYFMCAFINTQFRVGCINLLPPLTRHFILWTAAICTTTNITHREIHFHLFWRKPKMLSAPLTHLLLKCCEMCKKQQNIISQKCCHRHVSPIRILYLWPLANVKTDWYSLIFVFNILFSFIYLFLNIEIDIYWLLAMA